MTGYESSVPVERGDEGTNSTEQPAADGSASSEDAPLSHLWTSWTPSSVEPEASSLDMSTEVPESNASSGAEPLEEVLAELEHEELGDNPHVLLHKAQNGTEQDWEGKEKGSGEGSGELSGPSPDSEPTLPFEPEGDDGASAPDIGVTLIPHLSLASGWEQVSSAPQESRSEGENSAEPPVTTDAADPSKEQEALGTSTSGE